MIVRASRLCGTGVLALILSAPAAQAGVSINGNYAGATAPTLDNTYGNLEFALNMGGSALSRDGIAFTAAGTTPAGSVRTFLSAGGLEASINVVGTTGGDSWGSTTLGGGADPLFYTVTYANSSQGYTIDLTGLDAGKSYQLQFLFADPRVGNFPYTGTASVSDNLAPTPNTASAALSYGKTAVGDEFARLTAVVTGSTSFKFTSPNQGTGGPLLSGLVVHSIAPPSGQPVSPMTH